MSFWLISVVDILINPAKSQRDASLFTPWMGGSNTSADTGLAQGCEIMAVFFIRDSNEKKNAGLTIFAYAYDTPVGSRYTKLANKYVLVATLRKMAAHALIGQIPSLN